MDYYYTLVYQKPFAILKESALVASFALPHLSLLAHSKTHFANNNASSVKKTLHSIYYVSLNVYELNRSFINKLSMTQMAEFSCISSTLNTIIARHTNTSLFYWSSRCKTNGEQFYAATPVAVPLMAWNSIHKLCEILYLNLTSMTLIRLFIVIILFTYITRYTYMIL